MNAVMPLVRRELLDAVIANPAEDGPRLEYAGWLRQYACCRQDELRADLIEVQCELVKLKPTVVCAGGLEWPCDRYSELWTRERNLLRIMLDSMAPFRFRLFSNIDLIILPHIKRPVLKIDRGFFNEYAGFYEDAVPPGGHLDLLMDEHPVQRVVLYSGAAYLFDRVAVPMHTLADDWPETERDLRCRWPTVKTWK